MSDLLNANLVTFAYGSRPVLQDITLSLSSGQIVALLGPNGSGKSTLLKVLMGQLPAAGTIEWRGRALSSWRPRDLARVAAYLPQSPTWDASQSVADALRLGRAPYWGVLGLESLDDHQTLARVAAALNLTDLLDRHMDELSGGQRQRVLLARCLAQEPRAMLLDEPDTFLDLKHQLELHRLLRDLAREQGLGLLVASHDLNLAAAFADRLILLRDGKVFAAGAPGEVLTPKIVQEVYDVPMDRIERPGASAILVPRN